LTRPNEEVLVKKQQLEIILQKLEPFVVRDPKLEQYATPAGVAADIVWTACSAGDIDGRRVADLGCGNGVFCVAARLMGAALVQGIDIDPKAVEVARRNARTLGLDIDLAIGDVSSIQGSFDTVIQNPPFGAQTRHADRAFVEKALELAPRVYSLHNAGTEVFVASMVKALGAECMPVKRFKFEIPYAFEFHRKAKETFSVVLLKFMR
jgi:putative methylase